MSQEQLVRKLINESVIKSQEVIKALKSVDRGLFFTGSGAYQDSPQRIGYQATISAPHMHGYALEYLKDYLKPGNRVLDVGSGSGYLTACMAQMMDFDGKIIGVEHISELVQNSTNSIQRWSPGLIPRVIEIIEWDGRLGYEAHAPYKAIHVGACVERVPQSLIDQLDLGGRLMIPVGKHGRSQEITLVDRDFNGRVNFSTTMSVAYVPLCDKDYQLNR